MWAQSRRYDFLTALGLRALPAVALASAGVFASLSRRAVLRRAIFIRLFSASSSIIVLTTRVVLSIAVSGFGTLTLNAVFFVSFAKGHVPHLFHLQTSERCMSNEGQLRVCDLGLY